MNEHGKKHLEFLKQNIDIFSHREQEISKLYSEASKNRIGAEENYNSYKELLCESILPQLIKTIDDFEKYKKDITECELEYCYHLDSPKQYPCLVISFAKKQFIGNKGTKFSYHHRFVYLEDAEKLLSSIGNQIIGQYV